MEYLKRLVDSELEQWRKAKTHKPVLLRGARQVGKSSAVRHFGESFTHFVEVNFDRDKRIGDIFKRDLDVHRIVSELSAYLRTPIVEGETLLFFDEIQDCKEAVMSLRFFYEDMPDLHVVAAGSLLEFALNDLPTFGVGRIRSLFMRPMSFDEFLLAAGEALLLEAKRRCSPDNPMSGALHERLCELFRVYLQVGGMPESVSKWVESRDFLQCRQVQDEIIVSYETDFGKYGRRVNPQLLRQTLRSVASQIGRKFVLSSVGEYRSVAVREALELLSLAGIIMPVTHTAGNGLPLGAEANVAYRKYLFIDCGLLLRMLDDGIEGQQQTEDILIGSSKDLVNKGGLTEMVAGTEMLCYRPMHLRAELFYWQRTERGSMAEVDYLTADKGAVLPIEVKAGERGGMKSLYYFMSQRGLSRGVRCSLENFGRLLNEDRRIDIIPLYAISNLFV